MVATAGALDVQITLSVTLVVEDGWVPWLVDAAAENWAACPTATDCVAGDTATVSTWDEVQPANGIASRQPAIKARYLRSTTCDSLAGARNPAPYRRTPSVT